VANASASDSRRSLVPGWSRGIGRWVAAFALVGTTAGAALAQVAVEEGADGGGLWLPPPGGYEQRLAEPREVQLPNGAVMLDVRGLMTHYMYAHRAADGAVSGGCVGTAEELDAALGAGEAASHVHRQAVGGAQR
jgi:hypothetical protein